jgi:HAD superfamily hydrolase (TIGR01509 family)
MTPEALAAEWHDVMATKFATCKVLPGATALLSHLKTQQIPIALATSSTSKAVAIKRSVHPELFDGFRVIVCGDDPAVVRGKPHPDIFIVTAARLGIHDHPRDGGGGVCIVVEDSPAGVAAAKAAGMKVVAIPDTRFYDAADISALFSQADVILTSLLDWHSHFIFE